MSQALVNSDASSLSRAEGNVPPSTGDGRDDDPEFLAEFRDLLTGLLTDSLPDLGTFGRVIPWLDARQQSQPPFHPARSGIPKSAETRTCNHGVPVRQTRTGVVKERSFLSKQRGPPYGTLGRVAQTQRAWCANQSMLTMSQSVGDKE